MGLSLKAAGEEREKEVVRSEDCDCECECEGEGQGEEDGAGAGDRQMREREKRNKEQRIQRGSAQLLRISDAVARTGRPIHMQTVIQAQSRRSGAVSGT